MNEKLKKMRKLMLSISNSGKDGNLQSCFSSLEIIYGSLLFITESQAVEQTRHHFVLSKGQSNLALLTVLAEFEKITESELFSFCSFDSRISMQADRTKFEDTDFLETSAGSLGHGFPMAAGMAWGEKIKGTDNRVICLAGDGEMNEGTMWEALMFAASEQLNNLTLIIDDNHSIQRMLNINDWEKKLDVFGFNVNIINGNDEKEVFRALSEKSASPSAIIAKTARGYGSSTLMNDKSWFHRYPNDDELEMLCREVELF